jgi:probable HAF family extracellular repeat protein
LGAIAGANSNLAKGVNVNGQVVGTAYFPQTQYHPPKPGKHVAFIYSNGGLVDLNTLIPAGTGFPAGHGGIVELAFVAYQHIAVRKQYRGSGGTSPVLSCWRWSSSALWMDHKVRR